VVIEGLLAADDGGDVLSVDAVEMQMDVLAPLDRRRRLCGGLYAPLRCGGDAMHHAGRFQPRLAHAERHEGHSPGAGEAEQDAGGDQDHAHQLAQGSRGRGGEFHRQRGGREHEHRRSDAAASAAVAVMSMGAVRYPITILLASGGGFGGCRGSCGRYAFLGNPEAK
jgi:hypothetical protein